MNSATIRIPDDWGIILVDAHGRLVGYDEKAKELFELDQNKGVEENLNTVLGFQIPVELKTQDNTSPSSPIRHTIGGKPVILYPRHTIINNEDWIIIFVASHSKIKGIRSLNQVDLSAYVVELKENIKAIMECSHDGIILTDKDGNFLRWNRRVEEIYGVPAAEIISGKDMIERGVYQHSSSIQALKDGRTVSVINVSRKGKQILSTATPITDRIGNITGTVVNVRDLTELKELESTIEEYRRVHQSMKHRIAELQKENFLLNELVVHNEQMQRILRMVNKVADTDEILLITGETGVGKSLLAEIIHKISSRRDRPFMALNTTSIPLPLFESELFGYEKGAFTGASVHGKPGLIELAHTGTLFLDEISEIPISIQSKLLDVIESREVRRIGGKGNKKIDIRIIAATNQDIKLSVKKGLFRNDLYYRINVIRLEIPPLRERGEDVVLLADSFLRHYNKKYGKCVRLGKGGDKILMRYKWPGNIRELKNLILRLVLTSSSEVLTESDMANELLFEHSETASNPISYFEESKSLKEAVVAFERQIIQKAMEIHGSTYKTARALGISQSTVVRKIQKSETG